MKRHIKSFSVLAACVAAVSTCTVARAQVSDIRSARISAVDAPPGFSTPRVKLYSNYVSKMKIRRKKGPTQGTASCQVPSSAKKGWKQGMIEDFSGPSALSAFQLCAYVFTSCAGAHRVFTHEVSLVQQQISPQQGLQALAASIGDESYGVGGTQQGLGVYESMFRHQNALIELIYLGPSTFDETSFIAVAQKVDSQMA